RFWGLDAPEEALLEIAATLGADVPACLRSEVARGTGRGDVLASQDGTGLEGTPLLLVNPGVGVSTAEVYRAWDGVDQGPMPLVSPLATAVEGRNDLQEPACALAPEIRDVLAALQERTGLIAAKMSGSGATCFALFESDAAMNAAADDLPSHWWQLRTRLR
ncbi:MAG TPA: 4-(cytidine 5'-diphospho)-2-C-methyl-D-erythritol kinase, partial [Allosphingosinicella sp.]